MSKVIGIDLGSTASELAVIEGGKAVVIPNEDGSFLTPSVVSIIDGERKVGSSAKRQQIVNPKNTIYLIKRFMGKTYEESEDAIKHVQYDVVNVDGRPRVKIGGKTFSPEEISSYILGKMKKIAEDYLGEEVKDAVITVPAFFSENSRRAVKVSGELCGLNVIRVLAEPTAAILSSNIDMQKGGKYMVVDFGGSTLDNSVADISDGVVEILSTNGDVFLGGSDIDKLMADYVVSEFKKGCSVDISKDPQAMTRVLEAVEKAKIELSNSSSTDINIPYITIADNVPQHLVTTVTRAKFEQLIDPIVKKLINCAKKAVELAKLEYKDLDGILLIGGSCRIPKIQEELSKEFGVTLLKSSNMDLAVAEGAAIQANNIVGGEGSNDLLLLDINPISLSVESMGGVATKMINSGVTIPCDKEEVFTTAADNQTSITVHVVQGERPMAKDNKSLGMFNLDGILPAKRGVPQILIKFSIDVNGILTVTAKDKGTGKEQSVRIEGGNKLSDEEINRIKAEAEKYAEQDKKLKETADKLNAADGFAFSIERSMDELKDKITDAEKEEIKPLIEKIKEAVKEKDVNKAEAAQKELEAKWGPIMQKVYQSQGGQQGPTSNPFGPGGPFGDAFGKDNPFSGFNPNQASNGPQDSGTQSSGAQEADFEEVK